MNCEECGHAMAWSGKLASGKLECPRCEAEKRPRRYVLLNDKAADAWLLECPCCAAVNVYIPPGFGGYVGPIFTAYYRCDMCDEVSLVEVEL